MDAPFPDWIVPDWEHFLSQEHRRGKLVYDELFETNLFPLQRQRELAEVIAGLRRRPTKIKTVMEIGADKGGTLYHWLQNFPVERAIACEIRGTPYAALFEKTFPEVKFLWLNESSTTASCRDKVAAFLGETPLDMLFIDGDKSHFGDDFDLYVPLMRGQGVAMMHDINDDNLPMQKDFLKRAANYNEMHVVILTEEADQNKCMRLMGRRERETPHTQWLDIWGHSSCGFGIINVGSRKG
jgi:predicted O-methyltransferase YrrM